ncbi:lipopolysaccharide biosynthesis protein RfbH [Dethiosulfatarculus sandiegensis]|uniref:Lipopolysaccharide biosynthesis protein n=1 Tax=Dethiosulfatarculus sandiegensis TaxID=1429043 RepID=A0A0D2IXY4_9BACT|nr:lipopolysaccharide biosynthesis protein RfbH [Dethiosulfatarculus sandiegensis]KIX10894.1 lipopolysaccharide biosynthesis protein [Dethiosulfatarculus sandiegensis]
MSKLDELKKEILAKTREYYELAHKDDRSGFRPGQDRINYGGRVFDHREMENLLDSSLEFWLTYGRYSKQLEKELAQYIGAKHCFLVNSGSSANLLAFFALTSPLLKEKAVKRGDEVITTACGFPTTVAPVVQFGAVPVFVDVSLKTANALADQLEKALSPKTKAVFLAHTLGNPFDLEQVSEFCKKHGLWLIEDNCDAMGSLYDGRLTGSFGIMSTASFYPAHHMTTGEGGAVFTSDPLLKKALLSIRDWGRDCFCQSGQDNSCGKRFSQQFGTLPFGYDHKYVYSHFGLNLKMSDMQAAIGCAQLEKLPGFVQKRRENFDHLKKALQDLGDYFHLPEPTSKSIPSWFGFLLTVRDEAPFAKQALVEFLESRLIQTRNLFCGNIVRQPLFENLELDRDYRTPVALANTDKIMNDSFWIGVYPGMTPKMLDYMAQSIRDFVGSNT